MSTTSSAGKTPGVSPPLPQTSGLELSALGTLFTLTIRSYFRGWRIIVLLALALLPGVVASLVRLMNDDTVPGSLEFNILFRLIPHSLLPLTALLYGTGVILDEQEEQTLTYLLIRPLPKKALYVTKFLATLCIVALLAVAIVVVTFAGIYMGSSEFWDVFPLKLLKTLGIVVLTLTTYTAVFGCLSLMVKRYLIASILYIVVIEFILGNLDFAFRYLTVMFYFRVMALHWLAVDTQESREWSIQLSEAPEAGTCVLVLVIVTVAATFLAASVFARREFYVKTPETGG